MPLREDICTNGRPRQPQQGNAIRSKPQPIEKITNRVEDAFEDDSCSVGKGRFGCMVYLFDLVAHLSICTDEHFTFFAATL